MSKDTCALYPEAPKGGDSRVYKNLLERLGNRPLVNYIYAVYRTNNTAENMDKVVDNNGNPIYHRNVQGEHNMEDIIRYLDVDTMQSEVSKLSGIELSLGAIDTNGIRVDFTSAEDALKKADDFNDKHKGLSAIVVQHGDIFNIIVAEKNSRTHTYGDMVKKYLQTWDIYKQIFNSKGVDITAMPQELNSVFNALNIGLGQYLKNLSLITPGDLYKKDAMVLFYLNPTSQHTQNIINEFGSIEEAAQALDDFNHGSITLTDSRKRLLFRAINDAKNFQGIDMDAVIDQIKQVSENLYAYSPEQEVKEELRRLNKKYKIDVNEEHRIANKIRTLSEAAEDAAFVLQRQIRKLEKEKGNNAEGKRLEMILNRLLKELANKRYYSGIINFLGEASSQMADIDSLLQGMPQTGTELEKAFGKAKILQMIKSIKEQYYTLIQALANENLAMDENIPQSDIDNIRQTAKQLKDFFDLKDQMINDLTESTMVDLMTQIVGNTTPDGQSMMNAIRMAASDSTLYDWLYSMGRASNPVVAAAGSIIRNAQDSRDEKMNAIAERIRRATNRLYKAGFNSEFMYEDEGHIISDIDWGLYKSARIAKMNSLKVQGLKGFDLKQAIEDWEDQNTEDRVVDRTNGRTERVPNDSYRKKHDFKKDLSPEQIEYYDTMMQLKGEIGSLLPSYAQNQYLPPQVRRKFLDALHDAKNISDVEKAVKNKLQNLYTIREDDENYRSNGIIDGHEYEITEGDFDNTPLRQIPIFYVNKVEQGELLKNFSTGLQALAGTAINYNAMNEVADVVEFIGDFTASQKSKGKNTKADVIQNRNIKIVKELWKKALNSNTSAIMTGMISQHIYGKKREDIESKWGRRMLKAFDNIVSYTSFKGLVTNVKGAFQNYIMGEFQMLVDAGCGEFYGFKDFFWAHSKLFGEAGVGGEIMELFTNNINHKGVLFKQLFDPMQENFSKKSHEQYYSTWFRQLIGHDCSFIGYSSGEYLIHYVNMYALLHHQKVLLNGEKISLYDAFEVTDKKDGNSELKLKPGVTDLQGNPITEDYIKKIRKDLRYLNQTCHGSMNEEDRGIIHQKWWGRGIMNFRQWMPEHYSRRWRASHYDYTLGETREGYWTSLYKGAVNENIRDTWKDGHKIEAMKTFLKDLATFEFRAATNWDNLNDMQKYNIKRVRTEMAMYVCLIGLSFALGAPEDHKNEFWRRWWIYQTKRLILDTEAAMPHPRNISNLQTMLQSPMASVPTMTALLYVFYGLFNGDLSDDIKSGDHKGENRYWRNIKKYDLPFFKDIEQMQKMDTDDAIFKVFEDSPRSN